MVKREEKVSTRALIDKLSVRPGARVSVLGVDDAAFWEQLQARTSDISRGRVRKDSDCIFFSAESTRELERLAQLKEYIKPDGAIWVVSLKGKEAHLKVVDVIAAAIRAGMVDHKLVSFSETCKALRLVIPIAKRKHSGEQKA